MTVQFRPATLEDAPLVAELMLQSGAALMHYAYATQTKRTIDFLEFAFRSGKGIFGYQITTVGVDQDKVIFTCGHYATANYGKLVWDTLKLSLAFYGWRGIWPVLGKGLEIGKLYLTPPKNGIYLANICTATSHRGQGLFSKWFADFAKGDQLAGMQYLVLDVAMDNTAAHALYQRLGFITIAEKKSNGAAPITGIRRMHWLLGNQ